MKVRESWSVERRARKERKQSKREIHKYLNELLQLCAMIGQPRDCRDSGGSRDTDIHFGNKGDSN